MRLLGVSVVLVAVIGVLTIHRVIRGGLASAIGGVIGLCFVLVFVSGAVQLHQQRIIEREFWGPGRYEDAVALTSQWRTLARWISNSALLAATAAAAYGALKRIPWAVALLLLLIVVDLFVVMVVLAGGYVHVS
jgi:hypothetical protein